MIRFVGKSAHKGIAAGPAAVLREEDLRPERSKNACQDRKAPPDRKTDPEEEIRKLEQAVRTAKEQLGSLCQKAALEVGKNGAAIFEAHQMILEDENYLNAICERIRTEQTCAQDAVAAAGEHFSKMFLGMDDDYMEARAADIKDISERLLRCLDEREEKGFVLTEPSVIVAEDLTPAETLLMDRKKILAFVTVCGFVNSHTAILARMMNIPALVAVPMDLSKLRTGMKAIVDGINGEVIFEPDEVLIGKAEQRIREEKEKAALLMEMKGRENRTLSGRKIEVYANIGGGGEVEQALENDAGGIGLMRSEFLYLGRETPPAEEEQFLAYRTVLEKMGDKRVIIRTLDMGADKGADYLGTVREENPALGCRGIRICFRRPDLFKTQLRALLRASVYGNLSILYPMITATAEVMRIYQILEEVKEELRKEQAAYTVPEQGIMIETPAAVMVSDELARKADFFSVGTNDLTQYTLALDRRNGNLADFYDPGHKAVLRMIKMVTENAHRCGKRVGICGEMAADTALTEEFLKMGIDELSVSPSLILPLRKRIREIS